jgi:TNF receptor-associated protein 1
VFLRELISNASDSLEKVRHLEATSEAQVVGAGTPLEIHITGDEEAGTLTIEVRSSCIGSFTTNATQKKT